MSAGRVAITGGAGYVGSALVPYLLERGYEVTVLDLFLYGDTVFDGVPCRERLRRVKGDVRDRATLRSALEGADAVIHLACISNDPSFELDPALGKSINYDAFLVLLDILGETRPRRFVYASSSSVYGLRDEPHVREDSPCQPLTDYSKFKLLCEHALAEAALPGTERVVVRPATVCGWAPRLRLDLTVNILTIHALVNRKIRVFGGSQLRPNIDIRDMTEVYRVLLEAPGERIDRQVFNAGYENHSVRDLALMVREELGDPGIEIAFEPTNDLRSYHIDATRIAERLGFRPRHTIRDAVRSIADAFGTGRIPRPFEDDVYYNIKVMQRVGLR